MEPAITHLIDSSLIFDQMEYMSVNCLILCCSTVQICCYGNHSESLLHFTVKKNKNHS
jgi:hypothetical protein